MGSLYSKLCSKLCSNSSTHEGGHTVLNNNTVGGEAVNPSNPRDAAANAALLRAQKAKERGTRGGKLAQKLAEQTRNPLGPEPPEEERLVWD